MYPPDQPQWQPGMYRKKWLLAACLKRSYAARVFQESCLSLKHSALTWKHRTLMHFACVVGKSVSDSIPRCAGVADSTVVLWLRLQFVGCAS